MPKVSIVIGVLRDLAHYITRLNRDEIYITCNSFHASILQCSSIFFSLSLSFSIPIVGTSRRDYLLQFKVSLNAGLFTVANWLIGLTKESKIRNFQNTEKFVSVEMRFLKRFFHENK